MKTIPYKINLGPRIDEWRKMINVGLKVQTTPGTKCEAGLLAQFVNKLEEHLGDEPFTSTSSITVPDLSPEAEKAVRIAISIVLAKANLDLASFMTKVLSFAYGAFSDGVAFALRESAQKNMN